MTGAAAVATELDIRPYRSADAEAVVRIWLDSWRSTGISCATVTLDELRQRWREEIAGGWEVHVALVAGRVVGFVAFYGRVLEQLFIAPAHQGQGIGTRLLALARASMSDGFELTTAVESRAVDFYERNGLSRGMERRHPRFGHATLYFHWQPDRPA